jgi:hypothetical protein
MSKKRKEALILFCIAAWPFVFLSNYVLGLVSVGNNFHGFHYNYKLYQLAWQYSGRFPLWSPIDAAGFPLFGTPFAASVYPFNLLYLAHYAMFGGFTGWDYTIYTILAFSIFGVGLYLWLRRHSVDSAVAFGSVLIALMSLKLVELLRDPTAAHSAAWIPWLLLGIAAATDMKRLRAGMALFSFAAVMLLTAGYPYFIVYTPFLVGPYLAAMAFRGTRAALLGYEQAHPTGPIRLVLSIAGAFLSAAIISLPWLLQVRATLAQTSDRATPSLEFATAVSSNFIDTIGSWIFPPAAAIEGWYYFGILSTLLICSYLVSLVTFARDRTRERHLALLLVSWFAVVTYITWGKQSILFIWLWHHLPVFDQLRFWGRMNIILLPGITLLLALAISHHVSLVRLARSGWSRPIPLVLGVTAIVMLAVLVAQVFLLAGGVHLETWYWRSFKFGSPATATASGLIWTYKRNFDERYFLAMTVLAGSLLLASVALSRRVRCFSAQSVMIAAVVMISLIDLYPVSTAQWVVPYKAQKRERIPMDIEIRGRFDRPRELTEWPVRFPFERVHKAGVIESWDLLRHRTFFLRFFDRNGGPRPSVAPDQVAAARRLFGADERAQRIFVTSRIDHTSPAEFMADADTVATNSNPEVEVTSYTGNRLLLVVKVAKPGWLSFIDNWTPDWHGTVNGKATAIEPLFGSYKSVPIPAGQSTVEFAYRLRLIPSSASVSAR